MTITPNVSFGASTLDADDKRAALLAISRENARRLALDPPLPILPTDANPNIRQSYIAYLTQTLVSMHTSLINEAKTTTAAKELGWTAAELDAINALIIDRLAAGESKAAIMADVAA